MCAKRSGVVKRLKARKAHLLKLLNSGKAIKWNDSVKIHAEVEYLKNLLSVRKNQTTATDTSTYPVIPNIAKNKNTLPPPEKVAIPKLKKTCPDDCEGPLYSPFCEYTCVASTGAPP